MNSFSDRTVLFAMTSEDGTPEGACIPHEDLQTSDCILLEGHEILRLTMPWLEDETPVCCGVCFYDRDRSLLANCGVTMPYGRKAGDAFAKTVRIFIPREAVYFRTSYWRDDFVSACCPDLPFSCSYSFYSDDDRPFTRTLPTCTEMNNVIKRARQLTDIRWEPRTDIPRYCMMSGDYSGRPQPHFLDWFKAGHSYTGIPYSGSGEPDRNTKQVNPETFCGQWGYYKFHVGIDIDFETFITACRYPDSIFSERIDRTEPDFDSSPYGTYCSALVGYSLGYRQPLPKVVEFCDSANFLKVADCLTSLRPEEIRLCDILLYGAFHIAIITDLQHDSDGRVTGIEVSEATTVGNGNNQILYSDHGGLCRRRMWPAKDLFLWYQKYALYRIKSFQGIGYEKSEFVDVGNESNSMPVIDLPLIPYLGNGARYKKGHIVNDRILIGASGFSEVVIEKDGKPFKTLPIEGRSYINGGFTDTGSYTAYLDSEKYRSRSCRWTVE